MSENNKLPVKSDKKNLVINKVLKNTSDISNRTLKTLFGIGGLGAGLVVSVGASTLGVPILPTITLAGSIISGVKGLENVIYKKEPSLMFITRKSSDGTRAILQDALQIPSYLKDINNVDKACIMGLQTLIGFQRYKADLKIQGAKTINSNGKNIYEQKYSTVTHSVNLKNLEMLDKLGYIDIVSEEDKFHHSGIEALLGMKPRPKKGLLIAEKIGFSNKEGLKQIFDALKHRDKDELNSLKKDFKKITFRLTDKDIDFEDIYKKSNGFKEYESLDEKKNLKRLRSIFISSKNTNPGVLSDRKYLYDKDGKKVYSDRSKKIDIKYDRFGRPFLDYNAKESFGERIEREQGLFKTDVDRSESAITKEKSFDEYLKEGVIQEKESHEESLTVQSIVTQSKEDLTHEEEK